MRVQRGRTGRLRRRTRQPLPDGFYLIDETGTPTRTARYLDTRKVVGLGTNFLRVDECGHQLSLNTPAGRTIWARTFAAPVVDLEVAGDIVIVKTADASQYVINPATGDNRLACDQCTIDLYPTGITVEHQQYGEEKVDTHAIVNGRVNRLVAEAPGLQVESGPSILPVLTASDRIFADGGHADPRPGPALGGLADRRPRAVQVGRHRLWRAGQLRPARRLADDLCPVRRAAHRQRSATRPRPRRPLPTLRAWGPRATP